MVSAIDLHDQIATKAQHTLGGAVPQLTPAKLRYCPNETCLLDNFSVTSLHGNEPLPE